MSKAKAFTRSRRSAPHQEVDLVDGDLEGRVLTCMMHLWEFDVVAARG